MQVAVGGEPDGALVAQLDDRDGLLLAPAGNGFVERRGTGVEQRLGRVDEDEVERIDQIGEAAIIGQRFVPPEVP